MPTSEAIMAEESSQSEKRRVLANDQSVRDQRQASTYHAFGMIDADEPRGRFQNMSGTMTVIGATPVPQYPRLPESSPWHSDPVPNEEPLGFRVDEMPLLEDPMAELAAVGTGGAGAPSMPWDVETAPPSSSQDDDA
jgi:hypothetical protein